jgi:membrane fusion protein, multidrug efflux system
MPKVTIAATMLAAVFIVPAFAADPSVSAILNKPHDCIIEPFVATELGSPATGILEEFLVDRGNRVTKGMVVARLRSDLEQATLNLAKARAESIAIIDLGRERVSLLRKDAARVTELHGKAIAATSQLDKSLSELQQATLQLRQAETDQEFAVLEMKRAAALLAQRTIVSPIDGYVIKRIMAPGENVFEQAKIMKIAQIDPLRVEVHLPIAAFPLIKEGMSAEIRPSQPAGSVHTATVAVIDKVLDAASDTFGVRLILANPKHDMPAGVNCTATFPLLVR